MLYVSKVFGVGRTEEQCASVRRFAALLLPRGGEWVILSNRLLADRGNDDF